MEIYIVASIGKNAGTLFSRFVDPVFSIVENYIAFEDRRKDQIFERVVRKKKSKKSRGKPHLRKLDTFLEVRKFH